MIYAQEFEVAVMSEVETTRTHATLSFDTQDPYAITMMVDNPWTFSRDLFINGGGEGDVRVYFNDQYYVLFLYNVCGIVFRKDHVDAFLANTLTLVPPGQESEKVNWDEELKNILG